MNLTLSRPVTLVLVILARGSVLNRRMSAKPLDQSQDTNLQIYRPA